MEEGLSGGEAAVGVAHEEPLDVLEAGRGRRRPGAPAVGQQAAQQRRGVVDVADGGEPGEALVRHRPPEGQRDHLRGAADEDRHAADGHRVEEPQGEVGHVPGEHEAVGALAEQAVEGGRRPPEPPPQRLRLPGQAAPVLVRVHEADRERPPRLGGQGPRAPQPLRGGPDEVPGGPVARPDEGHPEPRRARQAPAERPPPVRAVQREGEGHDDVPEVPVGRPALARVEHRVAVAEEDVVRRQHHRVGEARVVTCQVVCVLVQSAAWGHFEFPGTLIAKCQHKIVARIPPPFLDLPQECDGAMQAMQIVIHLSSAVEGDEQEREEGQVVHIMG
mmetsp:Transcript_93702/g.265351  ORF Transcript_93702/g.265351 Transcript_93702/m.265351 type:complete len:332 (-) Transcript_93702:370-1365(-)